jgi:hypothetical protein
MTYLKIAGGLAVVAFLTWVGLAIFAAGEHKIQIAWDADKVAIAQVTATQVAENSKKLADALTENEGITNDLQNQLENMRNLNSDLASRLRVATDPTTGSGPLSKAPNNTVSIVTAGNDSVGQIDDAIAAVLTECAETRDNYKALIAELTPQLF